MTQITATMKQAKTMTGLSVSKLYLLIGEGRLDTVKVGRRRLVKVDSLRALLEAA